MQVIAVAPPGLIERWPENFICRPLVPQLELLPRMSLVISHGGHNTCCEALAYGLPLLLAPIKDDQPIVAEQVVRAGAGLRVKFGRVKAPTLRAAVETLLSDACYRTAAESLRESFGDGAAGASALISSLLDGGSSTPGSPWKGQSVSRSG